MSFLAVHPLSTGKLIVNTDEIYSAFDAIFHKNAALKNIKAFLLLINKKTSKKKRAFFTVDCKAKILNRKGHFIHIDSYHNDE